MKGGHFEDWELFAYQFQDAENVDLDAVAAHLRSCDSCSQQAASLRWFSNILSDKGIYAFAARDHHRPRTIEIREEIARAAQDPKDIEAARRTFDDLMRSPIEEWSHFLLGHPEVCTEALIRHLIGEARIELDRRPKRALLLLAVAEGITDRLGRPLLVAEHRGTIAKERANALRMLGRYPEALDSLDWAERFYMHLPAPSFELNFVEWGRASVFFFMGRFAEALSLARAAQRVFLQFGETDLAYQVKILEGDILCEQGAVREAADLFEEALVHFGRLGHLELIALLHDNLAVCMVRLDDANEARSHAAESMRIYRDLGKTGDGIRVRWTLGDLLMRQGHDSEALHELFWAARDFESIGMIALAGEVGLLVCELHLVRQEWAEAEQLARYLVGVFTRADAPIHRTRAFTYLRDAVVAREASIELINYLRDYLAVDSPSAPFEPPHFTN